jgi:hypothetical protein
MTVRRTVGSIRIGLISLGLVVLAGACGSATASSNASASTTATALVPTAPCADRQLTINYTGGLGAAAGRTYSRITLTNRSTSLCSVAGEANVTFQDPGHHPIAVPVSNAAGSGSSVLLEPGGSASEDVTLSSDGNPPSGQASCAPTIAFIEITAPGGTAVHEFLFGSPGLCPHTTVSVAYLVAGVNSPPV